ncbi:MAG: hypothetical protein ABI690_19275 [Chloroflexota bacterium]
MFKRGRVLILSVCFALALLAGMWVSAMPAATSLFTPTPDDFDVTATYLVAGATATAYARTHMDSSVPFPTQTPIDPIEITATALVVDATQKSRDMMATANPIDPIYVTSTYIVGRATQIQSFYMTATAWDTIQTPMPTSPPTWTLFPSDTPFDANATATAIQETADAYGTANTVAPFPTQDFLVLTDTANAGATANAQSIDPIYITATYIVGRATQTEAAYMTATAGGTLPTSVVTSTPTLSPEDEEDLIARWTDELERATGFSHPLFAGIAYDLLNGVRYGGQLSDEYRDFYIHPIVTRTKYDGNEYVVLVTREPVISEATVWIFRVTDGKPVLMSGDVPYSLGVIYGDIDPSWFDFKDFNQNGLPDLIVGYNSGGNCPSTWFGLLEIQPDGNIVDVAKTIPQHEIVQADLADTSLYVSIFRVEFVDVNQDGVSEVKAVGEYFNYPTQGSFGCNFVPMVRYYAWDGKGYKDITSTLDESYYPDIDAYFDNIKESGCLYPGLEMDQVVLDYFVLGRLKDGWAWLASQLHWEMCSPKALTQSGELMGKFLTWVGTLLDLEQQNRGVKSASDS